jgi:hypothetical protein
MRKFSPHTLERTITVNAITYSVGLVSGQRLYLQTNTDTWNKKIKSIVVKNFVGPSYTALCLTLKNREGEELISKYPVADLLNYPENVGNNFKPRLFDLYDIDTSSSYLELFSGGLFSIQVNTLICVLNLNLAQ